MRYSAALLVQDSTGAFLVLQRSGNDNHFPGRWELPGGKLDAGETGYQAMLREVREETGLVPDLPASEPVHRATTADGEFEFAFFTWPAPVPQPPVRLSAEHDDYKWVSPTQAWQLPLLPIHREFMERVWHQAQIESYGAVQPRYATLQITLEKVLNQMRKEWSPLAIVQARVKSVSSFAEKCLRKLDKYDDPASQLTDLCGGRVIAPTLTEAETVCRQIRAQFNPVDEDEDTRQRHRRSDFGYLSVHFVVHFRPGQTAMLGVAIPPEVAGLKAEIQVRTLLQHAHSEVTHDRLYKGGFKPPGHCEREAARVAAMLEEADDAFARFVHKLDAYMGHYAAHLEPARREREQANLRLVIEHEKDPATQPALALRLARLARAAWDWPGVQQALEPQAAAACLQHADIQIELGNALCQQHCDQPAQADYQRGLALLTAVAEPDAPADSPAEPQRRLRRAAALAWLGSALANDSDRRAEARNCLAKAVQLAPEDPYHLAAFVELDVVAGRSDEHIHLLASSLHQAAAGCEAHIPAGIEVTRAWLTLAKIRLLLGEDTGAIEALCAAAHTAEKIHPLAEFQKSLARLEDAIGGRCPLVNVVGQVARLLIRARENGAAPCPPEKWLPLARQADLGHPGRVLILAGSTAAGSEELLKRFELPLRASLEGFTGCLLTGGTDAGVCRLAARLVSGLAAPPTGGIKLVGYLPLTATASPAFQHLVRTPNTSTFSALEPVQMWVDLLAGGLPVSAVTLLSLGGGNLSAQELAIAWALGARAVAIGDGTLAVQRFAALLQAGDDRPGRGMILPDDPATLSALIAFDQPIDASRWEAAGMAAHQAFLAERSKHPLQSNLVPWSMLRDDFKHSNRHQAACSADILRQAGFAVVKSSLPAAAIPLPVFTSEEIERMAELEHGRWNVERLDNGWRPGEPKDELRKLSPCLVAWSKLPDHIKAYDREAVQNWPKLLAQAGLEIQRRH